MTRTPKAALVQACDDLDGTVDFFVDRLGFRLETIFPADEPRVAVITGHGLCLRLDRDADAAPAILRLPRVLVDGQEDVVRELAAPNGTRILLVDRDIPDFNAPATPEFTINQDGGTNDAWVVGRAGMRYRDLIPGRWNGHVVASHIRIPIGGPVPDYVHYHDVRFQMIYCHRGWVRVVYLDQGAPFVMRPGDCVLQPPGIRHQVLEASDGLEVIEIGCPALHATHVDHAMTLPSAEIMPNRTYGGQFFTRHVAAEAQWTTDPNSGFESRDLGIEKAAQGLARVTVHRATRSDATDTREHSSGFLFLFTRSGSIALTLGDADPRTLRAGDAVTLPPETAMSVAAETADAETLSIWISDRAFNP